MTDTNVSDILWICEMFSDSSIPSHQMTISDFDHLRKERSEPQDKHVSDVIIYFQNKMNCKRECEFELLITEKYMSKFRYQIRSLFLFVASTVPYRVTPN